MTIYALSSGPGVSGIAVVRIPSKGLGKTINDRLKRASKSI